MGSLLLSRQELCANQMTLDQLCLNSFCLCRIEYLIGNNNMLESVLIDAGKCFNFVPNPYRS